MSSQRSRVDSRIHGVLSAYFQRVVGLFKTLTDRKSVIWVCREGPDVLGQCKTQRVDNPRKMENTLRAALPD